MYLQNKAEFKRNEPDTISGSLLSKLIINLSKLLSAV
jgi:hypothetical protein